MRKNINIIRYSLISTFIIVFVILYLLFLASVYLIPNGYQNQTSFIMYIGFSIVIIVFFLFFFLDLNNNQPVIKFKFLSENSIKFILFILMIIAFFIPPVTFSNTVIAWQELELLNYFRAIIFLIGCAFLPGACLFNIMFSNCKLFEQINLEPFVVKIAFYPLISFVLLGISVLILDFIGLIIRETFTLILFILIIVLYFSDLRIQYIRNKIKYKRNIFNKKLSVVNISKSTFLIIIISIGVLLISLGIHDAIHYLISGDSWTGIAPAIYVGKQNVSPVDYGKQYNYPIFWGYISYALSVLTGIPLINVNALLAPFCYLHIIIIYFFMKVILFNFKAKYIVLSTIFVSIFSGIFLISPYEDNQAIVNSFFFNIGAFSYLGELSFIYKSFSLYLAFFVIFLFILLVKTNKKSQSRIDISLDTYKLIVIAALFLLVSYMIYMLPLIPCLMFIFIYIIFVDKKIHNLKLFLVFIVSFLAFFFLFDLMTEFFNIYLFSDKFSDFLVWLSIIRIEDIGDKFFIVNLAFLFYFSVILLCIILLSLIIFYRRFIRKRINSIKFPNQYRNLVYNIKLKTSKVKINLKKLFFILYLSIFTILLFLQIYNLFYKFYIFKFIYIMENYWYYSVSFYLDEIFLNFGVIGIIGIFTSYFCYKKNKKLFYILGSWLIFVMIYSSISIINGFWINNLRLIPPQNIEYDQIRYMRFWYSRNWYFIVPILCIFCAIGLLNLIKILQKKVFSYKYNEAVKFVSKLFLISILIISCYSSIITTAMYWGRNKGDATVTDDQAQVIGWVSQNVPDGSTILTEKDYNIFHGIETMTSCNYFHVRELLWAFRDYEFNLDWIKKKNITYAILYNGTHPEIHPTVSDFIDNYLTKVYLGEVIYQYGNLIVYTNSSLY